MAQPDMGVTAKSIRTMPGYGLAALVLGGAMAGGMSFTQETMMMLTIGVSWLGHRVALPLYDILYAKMTKD